MKIRALLFISLIICILLPAYGQKPESKTNKKITVSGKVTDIKMNPVSGARVFIDSLITKTTTDESGNYKLKISSSAKKIYMYSPKIGFAETDIRGTGTINFVLVENLEDAPAFLKSGQPGKSKKEIKPVKINTYTDIYQMIRQEVPGVVVSGKNIVVQGPNSFFGSTTPLFLVNGARVASIDYINPNEVKSIKLLKGSYANIYGVEGANGVISITLVSGGEK